MQMDSGVDGTDNKKEVLAASPTHLVHTSGQASAHDILLSVVDGRVCCFEDITYH
jgi:hypothetical protein